MSIKHFILIRYNNGLYTDNPYNVEDKDHYMNKRLPLFIETLKSLSNQTVKGFGVVVGLDVNTPKLFVEEIEQLSESIYPFIIFYGQPQEYVKKQTIHEEWLLTSRLDSDDQYYPEFIETLYGYINMKKKQEMILDAKGVRVKNGVTTDANRNLPNSPFISLLENPINPKTVFYGQPHTAAPRDFLARFISVKPLTKVIVHDTNVFYK